MITVRKPVEVALPASVGPFADMAGASGPPIDAATSTESA